MPFFGGKPKERLTRLEFEYIHIPAVAAIKRAFLDLGNYRLLTVEARLALANRVCRHCDTWWEDFGMKLPVDIPVATRPAAAKKKSPETVKVMPRGDNTIVLSGQVVKHGVLLGEKFLENGVQAEVTWQEYCALSRFFERLDQPEAAAAK
jgi:hypothetical protein